MGVSNQNAKPVPLQVRHVRDALYKEFVSLIPMADFANKQPGEYDQAFHSRALAAFALRQLTDCTSEEAAAGVIDGYYDQGIDAVLVEDDGPHLWLVQAKWSDQGKAGFDIGAAHRLVSGFRLIEQRKFERFNDRFTPLADRVHAAMTKPTVSVTFVIAVLGDGQLSGEVTHALDDAKDEFNGFGPLLDYKVYAARDIYRDLRGDTADPKISITVPMERWLHRDLPLDGYHGVVPVPAVAEWFAANGDKLFEKNIRSSLGRTAVNQTLIDTLCNVPEHFWYFNNGITILCDAVAPHFPGRRSPDALVELHLSGASIVNGAQTVTAIHAAMNQKPEAAKTADVAVRVICVDKSQAGLDQQITTAANTQNRVEARDFIALQQEQGLIRDDFRLTLERTYVYKRGEADPPPEAGCSVVEAALALAHAHRNPEIVIRAHINQDQLWDTTSKGVYHSLFGHGTRDAPGAARVWRTVALYRAAQSQLQRERALRSGRARSILDGGGFLALHCVFQAVDLDGIDDHGGSWDEQFARVPELTSDTLTWLIHHVDFEYKTTSFVAKTFTSPDRCRNLVRLVLGSLHAGGTPPRLPTDYEIQSAKAPRKPRKPSAVSVLLSQKRLREGALLGYRAANGPERAAMNHWVAADRKRGQVTWTNDASKPLIWAYDGARYSPSGLVSHMWDLAGWEAAPVAAQGTTRWYLSGEGNLAELAARALDAMDTSDGR